MVAIKRSAEYRTMDPYELQNRFQDESDQGINSDSMLVSAISERNLFHFEDFSPFIQKLPQREIDLIEMYYREEKKQKEIAAFFGVTQGAISHRLSRAIKRLNFLKKMPKLGGEIRTFLKDHFTPFEIDLLVFMIETTCQSKTAELLNKRYKLQDKNVMTQIKVRHKFDRYIERMDKLKKVHKELKDCCRLAKYIKKHLYMLHEVVLPHFNRGRYARL